MAMELCNPLMFFEIPAIHVEWILVKFWNIFFKVSTCYDKFVCTSAMFQLCLLEPHTLQLDLCVQERPQLRNPRAKPRFVELLRLQRLLKERWDATFWWPKSEILGTKKDSTKKNKQRNQRSTSWRYIWGTNPSCRGPCERTCWWPFGAPSGFQPSTCGRR